MNAWDLLALQPTDNLSVIKKAYASKLRGCRPDEDPEGFQLLKQAFEAAKDYARTGDESACEPLAGTQDTCDLAHETPPVFDPNAQVQITLQDESHYRTSNALIQNLTALTPDTAEQTRMDVWRQTLEDDRLWHVETRRIFSNALFNFLTENLDQPRQVWHWIDTNFQWRHAELALLDAYPLEKIHAVLNRLERHSIAQEETPPQFQTAPQQEIDVATNIGRIMSGIGLFLAVLMSFRLPLLVAVPLLALVGWLWWKQNR